MTSPSAEIAVLAASDTRSMKPSAATRPRLAALARTRRESETPLDLTFQIWFSDCCISPKTPEAVTSSAISPMRAASVLDPRCEAVSIAALKSWALCGPITPANSAESASCAASLPMTKPAIATTISRIGASEVAA